ncbi:hypothetical protein ACOMHN_042139 [Nucella lapillus]
MVIVMAMMMLDGCEGQSCTLDDIQSFQKETVFSAEKVEGHWFVNKAYGFEGDGFTWFTVDVFPTMSGLAAFFSMGRKGVKPCTYFPREVKGTVRSTVYAVEGESGPLPQNYTASWFRSQVTAAWDSQDEWGLLYLCATVVNATADHCTHPLALLVGRVHNPEAATRWLMSVNSTSRSSLPCFANTQGSVVQKGQKCPLQQMMPLPGRNCKVESFPIQQNFSLLKYTARPWKEMTWLAPAYIPESDFYEDYIHNYTIRPNGTVICDVSARNPKESKCLNYQIRMTLTSSTGKLIFHDPKGDMPYNVIHTDYEHFSLVYGCTSVDGSTGVCRKGRGWLWSRSITLERRYRRQATSLMLDLCLNPAAWLPTRHGTRESFRAGWLKNHNVSPDKLQGHWYTSKVYGQSTGAFLSYTVDFIQTTTPVGFSLKTSSRRRITEKCDFLLFQLTNTSINYVYSTPATSLAFSLVIAAGESGGKYALTYICSGHLTKLTDVCIPVLAMVVGRSPLPTDALTWMTTISSTVPCYPEDKAIEVSQTKKDDCFKDLKDGTVRQAQVGAGLIVATATGIIFAVQGLNPFIFE